ncbi:UNKNOWN [Stylonychia lemnae]|uniref:Uncharacterized protein n=1 Tax=Stylonychia lemnae TaxID=5949 RepID=A0A077ZT31_STYLE|nr:UNKNOWN [Stylonychia lemnae]|eukprot:CDW72714.1 UNKNOWN [Stylonychia lemnae]
MPVQLVLTKLPKQISNLTLQIHEKLQKQEARISRWRMSFKASTLCQVKIRQIEYSSTTLEEINSHFHQVLKATFKLDKWSARQLAKACRLMENTLSLHNEPNSPLTEIKANPTNNTLNPYQDHFPPC